MLLLKGKAEKTMKKDNTAMQDILQMSEDILRTIEDIRRAVHEDDSAQSKGAKNGGAALAERVRMM